MGKEHLKIDLSEKDIKRFWSKVDKKSDEECWEWLSSCDTRGYGALRIKNKNNRASRISWVLHNGAIPSELCVCHKCDNVKCVNPSHLFLGTHTDNMQDKIAKGRGGNQKGENNGHSKLTEKEVIEIREKYIPRKYSARKLAKEYNVTKTMILYIVKYKNWAHLP